MTGILETDFIQEIVDEVYDIILLLRIHPFLIYYKWKQVNEIIERINFKPKEESSKQDFLLKEYNRKIMEFDEDKYRIAKPDIEKSSLFKILIAYANTDLSDY